MKYPHPPFNRLLLPGLAFMALLLAGLACSQLGADIQATTQAEQSQIDTMIAATLAARPTETLLPSSIPTASAVPVSETPTQASEQQVFTHHIEFLQGGTSAFDKQVIHAGEQHVYTLKAAAGQPMDVGVSSQDLDVFVSVYGEDGTELTPRENNVDWHGLLPSTQSYSVVLTTQDPDTTYFLSIEIPAVVEFAPGAVSAVVQGYSQVDIRFYPDVFTRVRYLVYARAGQTMDVKLSSPHIGDLSMSVTGESDGQPYLRYEVKNSGFYGELPMTQGYYLDVYNTSPNPIGFTLEITIK